ncbi:hypothetical protein Tco_0003927 [Tanacetum coccineum]
MDPHTRLGRLCMDEHHKITFSDMIETEGDWSGPEYLDTTDSGKKKEVKASTFHRMESKEIYEEILISNECEKFVNGKLLTAWKSELYFVGFVINMEEDDVEPYEEIELEDEMVGEELIRGYKAIKEKGDPEVLDQVKPRSDKMRMLDHLNAKTIGCLLDVLCQVGVTTILANFMLLDVLIDRDVPIIVGRSFLYTCGAIMNTIKGKMSTFDGFVHQQFNVAKVRNLHAESDNDDDEDYCLNIEDSGKPFYGPNQAKCLICEDPMDRALSLQD